jgi:hypothetical protein
VEARLVLIAFRGAPNGADGCAQCEYGNQYEVESKHWSFTVIRAGPRIRLCRLHSLWRDNQGARFLNDGAEIVSLGKFNQLVSHSRSSKSHCSRNPIVPEIPNPKLQIPGKVPIRKVQKATSARSRQNFYKSWNRLCEQKRSVFQVTRFSPPFWDLGIDPLFGVWSLGFGICTADPGNHRVTVVGCVTGATFSRAAVPLLKRAK